MRAFAAIALILLCSSSFAFKRGDSGKIEYSCHHFNDDGEEIDRGYEVSLWFDASVTTRLLPKNKDLRTLRCEIDASDFSLHELTVECKSIDLTLTINQQTGRALATIKGNTREMICRQQQENL